MLVDVGIDRIIIGTQALKEPDWFRQLVQRFPGRVALGLDARDGMVATAGWLDVSQTSAFSLAEQFRGEPLAAVIYTNIANDGMMQGVDQGTLDDMERLCELGFPVIASGGVTTLDDVQALLTIARRQPKLVGAIVGRAIYEGTINLPAAVALSQDRRN
ncbi:MAG: HisA/HisF-related TIM barrel protein, partial [Leptolyngbyaceae bacterium]|nr:HisA/HisF-related TIM barrel protein [Leptolyngbyaceae bacterium]